MADNEVDALARQFIETRFSSCRTAGEKLAALRASDAVEPLLACLQPLYTSEDFDRAGQTATVLGAIGDRRAVPALLATLAKARDGRSAGFETPLTSSKGMALMSVVAALGQIGDSAPIEQITPLVGDHARYIRETAEAALMSLGSGDDVERETSAAVASLIGELEGQQAGEAALQLGQMKATEATEKIVSLLGSPDIGLVAKRARCRPSSTSGGTPTGAGATPRRRRSARSATPGAFRRFSRRSTIQTPRCVRPPLCRSPN